MADVTLSYKGSDILELSDSGSATLKTGGKYCEDDVTVEYVKPSGGGEDLLEKRITNTLTEYRNTKTMQLINSAFLNCSELKSLFIPNATLGVDAIRGSGVETLVVGSTGLTQTAERASYLQKVDILGIGSVYNQSFIYDSELDTIILRSTTLKGLSNINALQSTPFASGGTGGTIYIPKALYDHLGDGTSNDYKSATNWSTIDGYGTITWAKIEGSYYETHYADGTVIE